jgi:flavin-dependent dehydrogenase
LDAVVIGGGPAGATSALLLAKAGWSVALVEKATFPRPKVCGEFLAATNFPLLQRLGIAEAFHELAGAAVRQVGLFSGDEVVVSDMPNPHSAGGRTAGWGTGRALGRDHLDTMLLEAAAAAGATVLQPWTAVGLVRAGDGYVCTATQGKSGPSREVRARIVVAAHGSWELGALPTQLARPESRPNDLFGFKAHFVDSHLPTGLMPLLVFPGGYGGMVHSDRGRVSLSCCISRDQLARARRAAGRVKAAEAVLAHVTASCRGVRDALAGARLDHDWLSAGPIRPGVRHCGFDGIFLVGNAAGEAHPVIAEGIGMAMQSARTLCDRLTTGAAVLSDEMVEAARHDYSAAWRRAIAPRIRAASLIARWATRPTAVSCALPVLRAFPSVLTAGARLSGKASLPG